MLCQSTISNVSALVVFEDFLLLFDVFKSEDSASHRWSHSDLEQIVHVCFELGI